jgi:hypothetical protein
MADEIINNPFDYRAVTFQDLLLQINSNPLFAGKPAWLKTLIAGRADILMSYLDARANDVLFQHAYTKRSVNNFADSLGYSRTTRSAASGFLRVKLFSDTVLPVTISKADLIFMSSEPVNGEPVYYQPDNDVTFTSLEQVIPVREGRIYSDTLGSILLAQKNYEALVTRSNLISGTSSIVIGLNNWTEVANLVNSQPSDRHYRIVQKDTGAYVRGGDGVYGQLFPDSSTATITARYGGGTRGNLGAKKVDTYQGSSPLIESVINDAPMSGGAGDESLDSIKRNAPQRIVTQDRAVTPADFKYLAESFPGVAKALIIPNFAGPGSVQVQVVPNGGGIPTTTLLADLTLYLKSKTLLSGIFVDAVEPQYFPVDVDIEVGLADGATLQDVEDYIRLLVYFILHETFQEIYEIRLSEGIAAAIVAMNNYYGLTFDSEDTSVQNRIKVLMDSIDRPAEWGRDIQEYFFYNGGDEILGVEYLILNTPSGTVAIGDHEITTVGNILVASANSPIRSVSESLVLAPTSNASIESSQQTPETLVMMFAADADVT